MDSSDIPERPRLRLVDSTWVKHQGQNFLHLSDPIGVTEATIMVPEPVVMVLAFTDGNRTLPEIRSALALRAGLSLTIEDLQNIIGQLDQALMIDNGAFQVARRKALTEFRSAEYRPLSHAGPVYPRSVSALDAQIDAWCADVDGHGPGPPWCTELRTPPLSATSAESALPIGESSGVGME